MVVITAILGEKAFSLLPQLLGSQSTGRSHSQREFSNRVRVLKKDLIEFKSYTRPQWTEKWPGGGACAGSDAAVGWSGQEDSCLGELAQEEE